jgi:hypothetical protein
MVQKQEEILFEEEVSAQNAYSIFKIVAALVLIFFLLHKDEQARFWVATLILGLIAFIEIAKFFLLKTQLVITPEQVIVSGFPFKNQKVIPWSGIKSAGTLYFQLPFLRAGYGLGKNPFFNAGCKRGIMFNLTDGSHVRIGVKNIKHAESVLEKIFGKKQ